MTASDRSQKVTICDGDGHPSRPAQIYAHVTLLFGPRIGLTEKQINCIQWMRKLGAKPSLKKNMVRLAINSVTLEQYDRIVATLQKELIQFSVETDEGNV